MGKLDSADHSIQSHQRLPMNYEDEPVREGDDLSSGAPPAFSLHGMASASPASSQGQVGGSGQPSRSLSGRAGTGQPMQPRDRFANALTRSQSALNQVRGAIAQTRRNGQLSPLGEYAEKQLAGIASLHELSCGGPAAGEQLPQQMRDLQNMLNDFNAGGDACAATAPDKDLLPFMESIGMWSEEVRAQSQDRLHYLDQMIGSSPFSVSGHYETRAKINMAAATEIERLITKNPGHEHMEHLTAALEYFKRRSKAQTEAAKLRQGEIGDPLIAGTKKLSFWQSLLHPLRALAESLARSGCVKEIFATGKVALDTPGTNEKSVVEDVFEAVLTRAGLAGGVNVPRTIERAFQDRIDANAAWSEPIHTEIRLPVTTGAPADAGTSRDLQAGPQTFIARSTITPASAIFPSHEGKRRHGSTETQHAVDLALTQMHDPRDPPGKALFSGLRHGPISACSITRDGIGQLDDEELKILISLSLPDDVWPRDRSGNKFGLDATARHVRGNPDLIDAMRANANRNRALEIVALALDSDEQLRESARKGDPVTLDILSVSLLTPGSFGSGVDGNERLMLEDQRKAWKSVAGPQQIELPDGELVRIHVNPIAVNYGASKGGLNARIAGIQSDAVSGWHVSDALNSEGLKALFGGDLSNIAGAREGAIGERLERLEKVVQDLHESYHVALENAQAARYAQEVAQRKQGRPGSSAAPSELKRANDERIVAEAELRRTRSIRDDQSARLGAARELTRQIADIHHSGSYRNAGNEPHKMAVRLAVLGNLLGVKVAFNSKDGNGRTDELDAQIKHFTLQMTLTGTVPKPDRQRTDEEIAQFREVAANCGNREMQWLGNGFAV